MFKNLLISLVRLTKIHLIIKKVTEVEAVATCNKQVVNRGGTFLPEAAVNNLSNNPENINIGKGTMIRGTLVLFSYGGKITIGNNCYVGKNANIWSANNISIGDHVLISHNVNIIDTNSHELDHLERSRSYTEMVTVGHAPIKGNVDDAPIIIEDYAWINFNVTILKGVTVGKGAIIGAGSVVTRDVAPFTFVAGSPAKVVKVLQTADVS